MSNAAVQWNTTVVKLSEHNVLFGGIVLSNYYRRANILLLNGTKPRQLFHWPFP